MINIVKTGDRKTSYVKEFTADTPEEISLLPHCPDTGYSSTCFVISSSETYILNGRNEWVLISIGCGGNSSQEIIDKYVSAGAIDENGHLILTLSDGATVDCGAIS